ncbi:unnamed protein product [Mytilus coruscus]|uniref:Uncharacterized protein n=1 Tax=Mytilus coruscus TaxID=42192 RepID=A0A6J8E7I6_MYTCO|nr:unnamed protein product [Mytilus coruscus]
MVKLTTLATQIDISNLANIGKEMDGIVQETKAHINISLPHGKYFKCFRPEVRSRKTIPGKLVPNSKKLANLASSHANESLNMTIAKRASKYKHYSASSSLSSETATEINGIKVQLKDVMMWLTGSIIIPAIGFHKLINVDFTDSTFANTCALALTLKRQRDLSSEDAVSYYTEQVKL